MRASHWNMSAINAITLQVSLENFDDNGTFMFNQTWTVPRVVCHLFADQLASVNVPFFVADDDLAYNEICIGLPVLRHLQVDTNTLLESSRQEIGSNGCSAIGNPTVD